MISRFVVPCMLAFAIAGCSSKATPETGGRTDQNLLTQQQLASTNADNLYDALEKLRPEWLRSRGPISMTNAEPSRASIFMNGQMMGKPDFLRDVNIIDITEVRYWPAGPAAAKFGMGHPRGVIEITRR